MHYYIIQCVYYTTRFIAYGERSILQGPRELLEIVSGVLRLHTEQGGDHLLLLGGVACMRFCTFRALFL